MIYVEVYRSGEFTFRIGGIQKLVKGSCRECGGTILVRKNWNMHLEDDFKLFLIDSDGICIELCDRCQWGALNA